MIEIPEPLHQLCQSFHAVGARALVVGGTVRDAVLGRSSRDLDIEVFKTGEYHTTESGERVGPAFIEKKNVRFYGMSSDTAMNKHSGGVAEYRSSEGRTVKIPYKGKVSDTVKNILGGLRSTCTYVGAPTLKQLSKCTTFVRVNQQYNDTFK